MSFISSLCNLIYQAPVVSFSGSNWAMSGSTVLSIAGANFGIDSGSPTGVVGADYCSSSSWASATTVLCSSSVSTVAATHAVSVVVMQVVGSYVGAMSFDGMAACRRFSLDRVAPLA